MVNNPGYLEEALEVTGGLRGVPVIVIGNEFVRGFNKERINELLGILV